MMVESSPMWMGMDFPVSKDEKESLSAIIWFKALESNLLSVYQMEDTGVCNIFSFSPNVVEIT